MGCMSEITVSNPAEYTTVTIIVSHWNTPIGKVTLQQDEKATIGTTTSAAVKAASNGNGKDVATGSFGFAETAVTFIVSTNADGSLQLTKEPETAADTITFSNKCSIPVEFLFTPDDAATQTFEVPPGEEFPLVTATQWQASGSGIVSDTDNGKFDLPAVAFNNGNALLTVIKLGHVEYEIEASE